MKDKDTVTERARLERAAEKARNLRFKRPALRSAGFERIMSDLEEICAACDEVVYAADGDWELIGNLIGDEEEADEFRMLFPGISADAERLYENLMDCSGLLHDAGTEYDDCTVALLGECYKYDYGLHISGFDPFETDYFALTSFESDLATSESGKKLMRLTKAQMLDLISRSLRILMAYLDLRQRFDYLEASMDVIRGKNMAQIKASKEINQLYEEANEVKFDPYYEATRKLNKALALMPQRVFVE